MEIRRLILRVSLSCLAITALSAATLLFLPWGGIAGRFTLTCFLATIVTALCLPFALWGSRPGSQWGGLAGVLVLCIEFLLVLIVLWGNSFLSLTTSDNILLAMGYIAIVAPFLVLGARELVRQRVVGVIAVATALTGLAVLLVQAFVFNFSSRPNTPTPYQLISIGLAIVVTGGAAALGAVRARFHWQQWPRSRHWPLLAALAAVVSMSAIAMAISGSTGGIYTFEPTLALHAWRVGVVAVVGAYAIGLANLLLIPRLRNVGPRVVQLLTAAMALVTGAVGSAWIVTEDEVTFGSACLASIIVLCCGSIAVLLLARFAAEPTLVTDMGGIRDIEVTCPRCRKRGPVGLGTSACRSCGLRFQIQIEEARCTNCNQLLVHLASDRCTECGTPVTTAATPVFPAST